MTGNQILFVALERKMDEYKKYLAELAEATHAVAEEIGIGGMFQADDGVVYKIVIPAGKYVHFDAISYTRTKRGDEDRSPYPLAIKEAQAAGFDVTLK